MPNVYPHLDNESLIERCKKDIATFKKDQGIGNQTVFEYELYSVGKTDTQYLLKQRIDPLLLFFNKYLGTNDYVSDISYKDPELQKKLWIARTYLFYQLLIYAGAAMKFKKVYDEIFKKDPTPIQMNDIMQQIFSFRLDISRILHLINLGIFGSLNPTSDIDVGISAGFDTTRFSSPIMPYIVCTIERIFYIFTEKSSLRWDIEVYGDLFTLPNVDSATKNTQPDIFYLDTSMFTQTEFTYILQPVISGMLRNILLGYMENGISASDAAEKITEKSLFDLLKKSDEIIKIHTTNKKQFSIVAYLLQYDPTIKNILSNKDMFLHAKNIAVTFLSSDNTQQSSEYYKKLYAAEKKQMELLIKKSKMLTVEDIAQILSLYESAAVYKMENYISAPTIAHVVRILQASKNNLSKYATTTPLEYCINVQQKTEPYCIIGKYGYIISILEQIGYIIRFYNVYCIGNHKNDAKCTKKLGKYIPRMEDAVMRLRQLKQDKRSGGRRRTKRRSSKPSKTHRKRRH